MTTVTFADLGVAEPICRALAEQNYVNPTPIQAQSIPALLEGRDLLGLAQTGTGKTAAFALPILQKLTADRSRPGPKEARAVILAPTRELAMQISKSFESYGKGARLRQTVVFGGVNQFRQVRAMSGGVDILVATPGRLLDLIERRALSLGQTQFLVLDEADRMLDMGFIPDIEKIVSKIPAKRQTLLFSATFPTDIQRLAKTFQRDPVKIEVARPTDAAKTITQHVVHIPTNDAKAKRTALRRVIESRDVKNGIVFCNRKVEVDIVAASLQKHGHDAAAIHGDLPQAFRTQVLQRFRDGDLKLLVASDVAARGLDIPDVGHVFNYSPPPKDEDYVHRIGRTGRAGRTGESFTVVSPSDEKSWGFVLKMIQQDVEDYMPEGLLEELGDLPPDESRSRGRSRSGSRDDKSRGGRSRSRRRDENTDKLEEATPAESKPKAKAEEPKAKTEPKSDAQTDDRPEEKPKRERAAKPKRDRERDRKRKDDDPILDPAPEKVKGFGSDIPAFLKR
ncbi:DEAD/DEAH box helicase [Hyphomonas sp. UBA3601]|nr:DEAD/DEAH box helicase [Hyphomonas sp. UBA3601]